MCRPPSSGPDIKLYKESPVSGRSCLSLCVPILQGTKHSWQSGHSSIVIDKLDLVVWKAACTCAILSSETGLQTRLVPAAADQPLL